MAQFFEQKQAIAIRQMFDARLESIVIGSQALDLNDSVERHTYDTTDIYRKTSSKLSVEDPGIQLLLGRNGSGKSILLRFLETFGSELSEEQLAAVAGGFDEASFVVAGSMVGAGLMFAGISGVAIAASM